jgi:DNA primase
MSIIQTIKERLTIEDYIQRYVDLKPSGRTLKACCPFHSEKTPSFVVSPERQTWHCFGACSEGGDVVSFAMKYHHWDIQEAIRQLAKDVGIEYRENTKQKFHDQLYWALRTAEEGYLRALMNRPEAEEARAYLETRGIGLQEIAVWGMGFSPGRRDGLYQYMMGKGFTQEQLERAGLITVDEKGIRDRFRNRILFPIRDSSNRISGFGGRAFQGHPDAPKYLNSPESPIFKKSELLYGYTRARDEIRRTSTAILMEGYTDVILAHKHGYTNAVGQMGTALTEHHVKLLERASATRIILALDGDEAGKQAASRDIEKLVALGANIYVATMPEGRDPADCAEDGTLGEALDHAEPVGYWLIDQHTQNVGESPVERAKVADDLMKTLLRVSNGMVRTDYLQRLGERLELNVNELATQVRLPVPQKPAPQGDLTREQVVMSAFVESNGDLVYRCLRIMRLIGARDISREDFPTLGNIYDALREAMLNFDADPVDTVRDTTGYAPQVQGMEFEPILRNMLNLRLERIQAEMGVLIQSEQYDKLADLRGERQHIQERMRMRDISSEVV